MDILNSTPEFSRVVMLWGVCVTIITIEEGFVNSRVMWETLELEKGDVGVA